MEVVIYRARGRGGYLYDISLNPLVDYEILKKTRKVQNMNVISYEISIDKGEEILKNIYGKSSIFGKIISSEEFFLNNIFKKQGVKKVDRSISDNFALPSLEDIGRVEEFIVGKIVSLKKLNQIREDIGIKHHNIEDIIQALYCERRIKMVPATKMIRNKVLCFLCEKENCGNCCFDFDEDDILLYAADNYNLDVPQPVQVKKRKLTDAIKYAQDSLWGLVKSKREMGILWVSPHSFEYDILSNGIYEVVRRGGKVLYITSNSLIFEARENLKKLFEGARIEITNGYFPGFRELDISLCSYSNYPCFYKAFDLVIYDERHSFLERPRDTMYSIVKRAAKEKGKFLNITCSPDRGRRGIFKAANEIIEVPVSFTRNPIPEPRIITSRFLEGSEPFIPPMAMDVIKWSLHEEMRTVIFVPDEAKVQGIYYYLTTMEGMERDMIDVSSEKNKLALMALKKGECKILISYDFKDSLHLMEDVNVIVMHSDHEAYRVDTLVYIAAMATMHTKKNLAEVLFVALSESETMSLAKSTIRGVNKIAWEKGYLKR